MPAPLLPEERVTVEMDMDSKIEDLKGKTLRMITTSPDKDAITFETDSGEKYLMRHYQDCCEHVRVEEVIGDLGDLCNSPILQAEESTNSDEPKPSEYAESFTWTFYKLATIKGSVTIRWLGESNGYYSECVDFDKVT